ncbi:MAG: TIGR03088 family PEP-CTERM/XrtA system glycosyltransferase [Magnetococcales bacterium]|nr:TIGR03088 family PEP-CTERM/XrtA system glycosyltransferase [Magnetococcales bacterium]
MRIVHLLHRLDVGGLETVVVNLIDRLPRDRFEHHVVALTRCTSFKNRIDNPQVRFYELNKKEGKDWIVWFNLWKLLRRIQPDLVHTFNIGAIEGVIPAWFAGRPVTIHAEHGRDSSDPDGENKKYIFLRRFLHPWIDRFVAVSRDLDTWLTNRVGIPAAKVRRIENGIDTSLHHPGPRTSLPLDLPPLPAGNRYVIGSVGRLWPIKDQATLVRAMARLGQHDRSLFERCHLVLIGDGPNRGELERLARETGIADRMWITGWRDDVPRLLHCLDLFVLPSLAEGTPLTLLEAMACQKPVIATRVGGVADLLQDGLNGTLVPPADPEALSLAIRRHLDHPAWSQTLANKGRIRVQRHHALDAMVESYRILFQNSLLQKRR